MIRTIVVPLLGPYIGPDRGDEWVMPVVRVLANQSQAKVLLVSVLDVPSETHTPVGRLQEPALPEEEVARLVASRRRYLTQLATTLPGIPVDTEIRIGRPLAEILGLVARLDQPILVMATSRRLGISRLLYGSVALDVLPVASLPMVLVRNPVPEPWQLDAVIVALDGSAFAEAALESTLEVLGIEGIMLHLVHVIDYISGADLPTTKQRVASYLDQVASRLIGRGASVEWEIRTGAAAQELIRACQERGAGLIALATHGRSGLDRLLLGSVAERVVHQSPVPVLLVRPDTQTLAWVDAERQVTLVHATVRDIMAQPVVTIQEDATLEEVARAMLEHRVGSLPVVGPDGRLFGMLTDSDFGVMDGRIPLTDTTAPSLSGQQVVVGDSEHHCYASGRTLKVREFMSSPVVTATEHETGSAIVERMRKRRIKHIPVVRNGIPVGIVTRHDLLKLMVAKRDETPGPS
jgi:nucleotide-binding universal stress UspA family protein/predicted transcriptional regulator